MNYTSQMKQDIHDIAKANGLSYSEQLKKLVFQAVNECLQGDYHQDEILQGDYHQGKGKLVAVGIDFTPTLTKRTTIIEEFERA